MAIDRQIRAKGLGGSDIAAIVGLSPYKTPWDVFAEKTGLLDQVVEETNERLKWGKLLEQAIAAGYSERTGREIEWLDRTFQHPDRPWQVGTPDFECRREDEPGGDAKNVAWDQAHLWGEEGTDQVPQHYMIQGHWYMSLKGRRQWDFCPLFGGNDLRIYPVLYDADIEAALLEAGEKFWRDHILANVPPEIGASDTAGRYLKQRFPKNSGNLRIANAEEVALLASYRLARESFDTAKEIKDGLENRIKQAIGDDDGLTGAFGKFSWKKTKDGKETDWIAVAKEAGATAEMIAKHTAPKPGFRRIDVRFK
ncbi:MAG: YqaJ viral recombinase family protein [Acidobacteriales bacterium]|nr:YqaJ viral recombinase family protein [Terriglobales bacterium]